MRLSEDTRLRIEAAVIGALLTVFLVTTGLGLAS